MNSNRYAQLILYKAWPDLCRRRRRSRAFVLSGFWPGDLSEFFVWFGLDCWVYVPWSMVYGVWGYGVLHSPPTT